MMKKKQLASMLLLRMYADVIASPRATIRCSENRINRVVFPLQQRANVVMKK